MSYILSALKKVERKRRVEQPPDLLAMHAGPPAASGYRDFPAFGILKVLVAAGIIAAAVAWSLSPSGAHTMDWLGQRWSALTLPRLAISSGDAPPAVAAAVADKPAYRTVAVREFTPSPGVAPPRGAVADRSAPAPAVVAPAPRARSVYASPAQVAPAPAPSSAPFDAFAPAPVPAAPPAFDAALRPAAEAVDFEHLPADVRARLPVLSVTGHLYSSARPQANKIFINGAALREGQFVNEELMVREITAAGAVMEFDGVRFRLGKSRIFR